MNNINRLLLIVKENSRQLLLIVMLSIIVSSLWGGLSSSSYRAYITVAPSEGVDSIMSGLTSSLGGSILPGMLNAESSSIQIALATIRSKMFLSSFVDKYELYDELGNPQSDWEVHKEMMDRLEIEKSSGSVLINIYFRLEDPVLASRTVNNLVKELNTFLKNKELKGVNKRIAIYEEKIKNTNKVNVLEMLYLLLKSEVGRLVVLSNDQEHSLKVVDPSQVPAGLYWPNYYLLTAFSIFLSIFLSFCYLVLMFYKDKFRDKQS